MLIRGASRGSVAMLISIADIFFGMAAVIMILIVLASSTTERLVPDYLDLTLNCRMNDTGDALVSIPEGPEHLVVDWLETLPSQHLIQKVGIQVTQNELACFPAVERAFRTHNIGLDQDGVDKPVLTATLLLAPDAHDNEQ